MEIRHDDQIAGRDRRHPRENRRLISIMPALMLGEGPGQAAVVGAERHHRPAIVLPRPHEIELVATLRAMFGQPEPPELIGSQTLRVAMAGRYVLGGSVGERDAQEL